MSQLTWIDALRRYNAGMPSWCIPRKGTPGYETIGRMRRGEPTETPKELMDKLERKTAGRPKKIVKKVLINLDKDTDVVNVPTLDEVAKTDRPSTKKMSVSNNKEAMAVVPVNYVAEGGSKKVAETPVGTYSYDAKNPSKTLDEFKGTSLIPALMKLPEDIAKINADRKTPIRTIRITVHVSSQGDRAGMKLASFDYIRNRQVDTYHTISTYAIEPEFKRIETALDRKMAKKEAKEDAKEEAKEVDTPQVLKLLEEKKGIEAEHRELVRRMNANEIPNDEDFLRQFNKFKKRRDEITAKVRKLRLAQTKARKAEIAKDTTDTSKEATIQRLLDRRKDLVSKKTTSNGSVYRVSKKIGAIKRLAEKEKRELTQKEADALKELNEDYKKHTAESSRLRKEIEKVNAELKEARKA